jgi:putative nucleotidyltransferase with HDIG domain
MKKQILFIDDEPNILEGLRRMLRRECSEWGMQSATSGAKALEIMDAKPIDLIITDMRMPEMDGADLLREVKRRHPGVIRVVLSGQADSDLAMKAVGVAHQFISKPCDSETLKTVINRAVSLRALLTGSSLKDIISEMGTLPSVPALYLEMTEELQSLEPSIQKVGQIIARDPGMTAKVLQLTNSAFFGLRRRIADPADAVAYLGLNCIQHLFLAVHAFSQFTPPVTSTFSIDLLWEHSLSTAALAKAIAEEEEAVKYIAQEAFTAGLLHDIGKLIFADRVAGRHAEAANLARMNSIPLWRAEHQVFSVTHAEVGAYLLGVWGLPDGIVEAVAYHHHPMDSANKPFCALTAVHAADCQNRNHGYDGIRPPKPDVEYLSKLLRKTKTASMAS